jgi:HEPN domain-containing protein
MPDERQQAVREIVTEWMRHARSDMAIARMVENDEIAPEIIAFHAQQAVEKALKALLIQRQVDFPRTHVIGVLIGLCKECGYKIEENLEEATTLSRYAVASRYPRETDLITRQEAKIAADLAKQVLDWSENQIQKD